MARITRVAKAQQRYEMVPVLDSEGNRVKSAVTRKGAPQITKSGREVTRVKTYADKSKPLPNHKCDKCGKEIEVGQPYKHISPRSGPYGGRTLYRCGVCPDWHVWEYSSSLSSRTAEVAFNFQEALNEVDSVETVQDALTEAAEAIREIAEEKKESASNIEEGFGHETSTSQELNDIADQLESWADDIEQADIPDLPEPEEEECGNCAGVGHFESFDDPEVPAETCDDCGGTGKIIPDDPTDEQMDAWRDEVIDACSIVDECPV